MRCSLHYFTLKKGRKKGEKKFLGEVTWLLSSCYTGGGTPIKSRHTLSCNTCNSMHTKAYCLYYMYNIKQRNDRKHDKACFFLDYDKM